MKNKIPDLVVAFGVLVALFSILADAIVLGKPGVQAAQIFGMEVGATIALFGIALNILRRKETSFWNTLRDGIYNLPPLFWATLGVLPVFVPFVLVPMFFNSRHAIEYPVEYLQNINPIGNDFRLWLDAMKEWLFHGQTTGYVFTPLAIFLFAPFLLLGYPVAYYVITIFTLLSYLTLAFLAIALSEVKKHSVIVFIAAVSLFSYGLQFELERGQSHTIALMLCVLAIYIFHKQPSFRLFAYLLFCASIQLKFYPALFVVMFVDDWRDWKNNIIRFGALGLTNILALFLLGFSYFSSFYIHMTKGLSGTSELFVLNHSVKSFVFILPEIGAKLLGANTSSWVKDNGGMLEIVFLLIFLICFLTTLVNAYLKNASGVNANLLLVCVIGGMTVPAISHDYMLPMLAAPFALFVSDLHAREYPWGKWLTILLIVFLSFVYALTLFPIEYKPAYLQNEFPMLFIILIAATLLNVAQRPHPSPLP